MLQSLDMSPITTPNQFLIFAQGTFFEEFLGKYQRFYQSAIMSKLNLIDSCKRLQNFVNEEALVMLAIICLEIEKKFKTHFVLNLT